MHHYFVENRQYLRLIVKIWFFFCDWYFLNMHFFFFFFCIYMLLFLQNSQLIFETWTIRVANIFFLKCTIFFGYMFFFFFIENWQSLLFFATNCQNINFLCRWYYLNAWFFCINKLLVLWKLVKFVTSCQNMNFSCGCFF